MRLARMVRSSSIGNEFLEQRLAADRRGRAARRPGRAGRAHRGCRRMPARRCCGWRRAASAYRVDVRAASVRRRGPHRCRARAMSAGVDEIRRRPPTATASIAAASRGWRRKACRASSSRTSKARAMRSVPKCSSQRRTSSGSVSAALPTTARAAPSSSTCSTAAKLRRPPPTCRLMPGSRGELRDDGAVAARCRPARRRDRRRAANRRRSRGTCASKSSGFGVIARLAPRSRRAAGARSVPPSSRWRGSGAWRVPHRRSGTDLQEIPEQARADAAAERSG